MNLANDTLAPTTTRLVPRGELRDAETESMFRLLSSHFEGVTRERFEADLAEKNWALLIEREQHLVGFTTILVYETSFRDEPVSVIYSGDTIVAPEAWNSSALPRGWIESVARLRALYPRGPYVWLLITSGFRTYRFLPLFWRRFFPRFDEPTPEDRRQLLDHLAVERFGRRYDPPTGVVGLESPQRLRESLAGIPPQRTDDPHIAFFASRNPGHACGDELVCLTELSPDNLTPAGRRMARAIPTW